MQAHKDVCTHTHMHTHQYPDHLQVYFNFCKMGTLSLHVSFTPFFLFRFNGFHYMLFFPALFFPALVLAVVITLLHVMDPHRFKGLLGHANCARLVPHQIPFVCGHLASSRTSAITPAIHLNVAQPCFILSIRQLCLLYYTWCVGLVMQALETSHCFQFRELSSCYWFCLNERKGIVPWCLFIHRSLLKYTAVSLRLYGYMLKPIHCTIWKRM